MRAAPAGRCSMHDVVRAVLGGEEAWIVGGAVRDELLGRPVLDVDVVCHDPAAAARAAARRAGGAPFALSEKHASWRVVLPDARTLDFTPVHGTIEGDLARRDFTINAIATPVAGGEPIDPSGGRARAGRAGATVRARVPPPGRARAARAARRPRRRPARSRRLARIPPRRRLR